jgi:hypothetical protein
MMSRDWKHDDWQAPEFQLTTDHLTAIGRVIAEWALMEREIAHSILLCLAGRDHWKAYDGPGEFPLEEVLMAGMESRTAVGYLRALGERHAPAQAERLGKLLDKILSEGKRRNVIAHAGWRKSRTRPGSIETFSVRGIGGIVETKRQYTVSELR